MKVKTTWDLDNYARINGNSKRNIRVSVVHIYIYVCVWMASAARCRPEPFNLWQAQKPIEPNKSKIASNKIKILRSGRTFPSSAQVLTLIYVAFKWKAICLALANSLYNYHGESLCIQSQSRSPIPVDQSISCLLCWLPASTDGLQCSLAVIFQLLIAVWQSGGRTPTFYTASRQLELWLQLYWMAWHQS